VHEILVIHPVEPTGGKSTAEGHFQRVLIRLRERLGFARERGVDRLAINGGDGGDILR